MTAADDADLAVHLSRALDLATGELRRGGAPFTALVVAGGRVLGTGANREREDRDPTAHAEIVALRAATARHGRYATAGALLVASGEPCALCYHAARWAGIGRIAFAADREQAAAAGYDYTSSYRVFAIDPRRWSVPATHLPVPGTETVFPPRMR